MNLSMGQWLMSLSVGVTSLFFSLTNIKENNMAIDFRRNQSCSPPPTYINGNCIEMVDQYKYLGTMIDKKLKFDVLFARRGNNDCTSF